MPTIDFFVILLACHLVQYNIGARHHVGTDDVYSISDDVYSISIWPEKSYIALYKNDKICKYAKHCLFMTLFNYISSSGHSLIREM